MDTWRYCTLQRKRIWGYPGEKGQEQSRLNPSHHVRASTCVSHNMRSVWYAINVYKCALRRLGIIGLQWRHYITTHYCNSNKWTDTAWTRNNIIVTHFSTFILCEINRITIFTHYFTPHIPCFPHHILTLFVIYVYLLFVIHPKSQEHQFSNCHIWNANA